MFSLNVPAGVFLLVETVKTEVPAPFTVAGLKVAVVPAGRPVTLNVTVPLNPNTDATFAAYLVLFPFTTVSDAGDAVSVKPETFTTTEVVWVTLPLVPVIVTVYEPSGVALVVATVSVELPAGGMVNDVGLSVQVAPVGHPLTVRLTVPLNPLNGVAVAV